MYTLICACANIGVTFCITIILIRFILLHITDCLCILHMIIVIFIVDTLDIDILLSACIVYGLLSASAFTKTAFISLSASSFVSFTLYEYHYINTVMCLHEYHYTNIIIRIGIHSCGDRRCGSETVQISKVHLLSS